VRLEILLCQAQPTAEPSGGARVVPQPAEGSCEPMPACVTAIVDEQGLVERGVVQVMVVVHNFSPHTYTWLL